ncbi:hypothetical protein IPJ72_04395 [Candidatus Peregrinibacteria bacterium]|nr:MAG: hypothetical protein IPJ72_04395 [Candidatus Peregrinibacteria bacterium]
MYDSPESGRIGFRAFEDTALQYAAMRLVGPVKTLVDLGTGPATVPLRALQSGLAEQSFGFDLPQVVQLANQHLDQDAMESIAGTVRSQLQVLDLDVTSEPADLRSIISTPFDPKRRWAPPICHGCPCPPT